MIFQVGFSIRRFLVVFAVAAGIGAGGRVVADEGGRTGRTATGCSCHNSLATPGVLVSISGPQQLDPSAVGSYTISVAGSPTQGGGFDLRATGGTLAAGSNNHLSGGELTQNNGASRSWSFTWTAPAANGTYDFYAVGLATNQNGSDGGDSWNWYGGAANTAFPIEVATSVGTDGASSPPAYWLAAPRPNPSSQDVQLAFSIADPGPASVEAFDVSGRRVAVLLAESLPAGQRTLTWDGRDARGRSLNAGVYLLRLRAGGRELTQRLIRISS